MRPGPTGTYFRYRSIGGPIPSSIHDRRWWVLTVLCGAVLIVVMDNTIVNVALPVFSRELHASNSSLQWIVDAYSLPFAGLLLAGGWFSDWLGRKRVMQWALGAFGVFSVMAAGAHSVDTLLVARALMGAAAAFVFPATLSTLTVTFDDLSERAKAFGIWGATSGVAIAVGPIAGGLLLVHFWYGSVFLINAPLVAIALLASARVVPESRSPRRRCLDFGVLFLGTAGVSLLTLALIEGPTWGWSSDSTVGLFGLAMLSLITFVSYERRRTDPLLDVHIFTNRAFSAGAGAIAVNFFCLFGFIFLVTQYFQLIRGYSPLSAGVHTLAFALVVIVVTPLGVMASLRFGARYVVSSGLVFLALGLAWGSVLSANAAYFGPVIGLIIVFGVGFSLVNAPSTASLMNTLTPDQIGAGTAVSETTRELAGTLGVAVMGSVFSSLFGPSVRRILRPYLTRGLTLPQLHEAATSTRAAQVAVSHLPAALRPGLDSQVTSAFMLGLHRGCFVAAVIAAVAALVVLGHLPQVLNDPTNV